MPETETKPRSCLRFRWWMLVLVIALALSGSLLFVRHSVVNVMHPALDELSAVSISERWSHPQMLKIRALGEDAVPSLRRVLSEKEDPVIETQPVALAVLGEIGPRLKKRLAHWKSC